MKKKTNYAEEEPFDTRVNELIKSYKLEDRTAEFSLETRRVLRKIKLELLNESDVRQVLRSSGSVAANYIEANENLGEKDFRMRIKICRKEAKESALWLGLLNEFYPNKELDELIKECKELIKIFSAILNKSGS